MTCIRPHCPLPEPPAIQARVYIYVAGPMRGYPEFNFPAFDRASDRIRSLGWPVLNPADLDRAAGFRPSRDRLPTDPTALQDTLASAMFRDLYVISFYAYGLYVLNGWWRSEGARTEIAYARYLNLQITLEGSELKPPPTSVTDLLGAHQ